MPPPPTVSPVTGSPIAAEPFYIHSDDSAGFFRDVHGRTLLLRGINLSSNAKTPLGQPGYKLEGFWEGAESGKVTFKNRVLDLDIEPGQEHCADEHLRRLRSWGFNTLRYVTTWEAIEHEGPGIHDEEYIQYTIRMLRKCKEHGFLVYLDPHQDLWSRFSGGSGAPYWTLLACGLNPRNFTATNAAVLHCEWPDPQNPDPANFPDMIWASNYTRLATMTLFTLFFAGIKYAPLCIIDGRNIQDYLQSHYFNAFRKLGEAIKAAGDLYDVCVIGWDSLNEPNPGLVGNENITVAPSGGVVLQIGPMPTALEAMRLGMGIACEVESWKFGALGAKREGTVHIDPKGSKAWLEPEADLRFAHKYGWKRSQSWRSGYCIWALHGVWDPTTQQALKPCYFSKDSGQIHFARDFWLPHWQDWAEMVRQVHPEAIHFVLPPVLEAPPSLLDPKSHSLCAQRVALSSHFYDGLTLITKHWNWFNADAVGYLRGKYSALPLAIRVGEPAIRKCFRDELGYMRHDAKECLGNYPSMMGEIGIPFDLDKKQSYRTGDYRNQSHALDASLNACDGTNLFNYTIWTYNSENTHRWGENWNGEDLSVWALSDIKLGSKTLDMQQSASLSFASSDNSSRAFLTAEDPTSQDAGLALRLNAGARAIEAFVRPYPTAVAGVPISIDFNIKTSHFQLIVDTLPTNLVHGSENVPTEIYLPAVHYGSLSQEDVEELDRSSQAQEAKQKHKEELLRQTKRRTLLPHIPHLHNPFKQRAPLALNVKVSHGHYEIDGHTLKWYHSREGVGSTEKIEISRRGGPRMEVMAAYGDKPPSFAEMLWDQLPKLSDLYP